MWDFAELDIELDYGMTDGAVLTIRFLTPSGTIYVIADVHVIGRRLVLSGLHMHGMVANSVGLSNLRKLAQFVMKEYSYDAIVIEGGVRTSGANPGRTPGVLRFTRKA